MVIALIPARGGSERIPKKNIKELGGHPLLSYAIAGAKHARIFDGVYVSTEDPETQAIAIQHGAEVIKRPAEMAQAWSADIEWLTHALVQIRQEKKVANEETIEFMILPPTNPFRTAKTILRAWAQKPNHDAATLRAVGSPNKPPEKMWRFRAGYLTPLMYRLELGGLQCDIPTQQIEGAFEQNGCIRIATDRIVGVFGNPTGALVVAFFTQGYEGLDLNTQEDWDFAEYLIKEGKAELEPINETFTIQTAAAN